MSNPTNKETAMKARIISHMNADHQSSLRNYLQYYNRIPSSSAKDARLDDVTLTHLSITCSLGRFMVPFDPPMKSLMEVRERTVALHHESLKGLGKSVITINEYRLPRDVMGWVMPLLSIWAFQLLVQPNSLEQGGSLFFDRVLQPYAPRWFVTFAQVGRYWILAFMIVMHSSETLYLWRSRLEVYNTERFGSAWWKWIVTGLLSGFPVFVNFDGLVKEIEEKKGPAGKPMH